MATTEIGYEDSYLASDKNIRRAIRAERVGKYIRKVGNVVSAAILFGGATVSSPAHSQEAKIDFMKGCETMITQDGYEVMTCNEDRVEHGGEPTLDDTAVGIEIRRELQANIKGVPTDEFRAYMTPEEYDYYMTELAQGNTGNSVGNILGAIESQIGMTFGGQDIPMIIDMVITHQEGGIEEREHLYKQIIEGYPALHPHLHLILTRFGLNPMGEEA